MASDILKNIDLRIQMFRGSTEENDLYKGREGELTIEYGEHGIRYIREHDGLTIGGHRIVSINGEINGTGVHPYKIICNNWATGDFVLPNGFTANRIFGKTGLELVHSVDRDLFNFTLINTENPEQKVNVNFDDDMNVLFKDGKITIPQIGLRFNKFELNITFI